MSSRHMLTPDEYMRSLGQEDGPIEPAKRPGRWRRLIKIVLWVALAILTIALILAIKFVMTLSDKPFSLMPLTTDGHGRTNILILGTGDPGHAGEKLSDTNLLVSLDRRTKRVVMVGLPRDLRVPIPGYGFRKLNQANSLGGPKLAEQTVADITGLSVNYYVASNFRGLKDSVDAVGGIDVAVRDRLYDPEYPCDANEGLACGIDIKPGNYHMDGTMVLQYTRCRKGTCGNDFGRAARQQEILGLLQHKSFSREVYLNPARLTALSAAVSRNIQTDLSTYQLVQVGSLLKYPQSKINFVLSTDKGGLLRGDPGGSSDLLPLGGDFDAIRDYLGPLTRGEVGLPQAAN